MAGKFTFGSSNFGEKKFGNLNLDKNQGAGASRAPSVDYDALDPEEQKIFAKGYRKNYDETQDENAALLAGEDSLFTYRNQKQTPIDGLSLWAGTPMQLNLGPIRKDLPIDYDKLDPDGQKTYARAYRQEYDRTHNENLARLAGQDAYRYSVTGTSKEQLTNDYMADALAKLGAPADAVETMRAGGARPWDLPMLPGTKSINEEMGEMGRELSMPRKADRGPGNGMAPYWNPNGEKADDEISTRYDQLIGRLGGLNGIADPALRERAKALQNAIDYERGGAGTYRPTADDLAKFEDTLTVLEGYAGFKEAAEENGYGSDTLSQLTGEALGSLLSAYNQGGAEAFAAWDAPGGTAEKMYGEGTLYRPEGEETTGEYSVTGGPAKEEDVRAQADGGRKYDTGNAAIWQTLRAIDEMTAQSWDKSQYQWQKDLLQAYMNGQAGGDDVRNDVIVIMKEHQTLAAEIALRDSEPGSAAHDMADKRMASMLESGEMSYADAVKIYGDLVNYEWGEANKYAAGSDEHSLHAKRAVAYGHQLDMARDHTFSLSDISDTAAKTFQNVWAPSFEIGLSSAVENAAYLGANLARLLRLDQAVGGIANLTYKAATGADIPQDARLLSRGLTEIGQHIGAGNEAEAERIEQRKDALRPQMAAIFVSAGIDKKTADDLTETVLTDLAQGSAQSIGAMYPGMISMYTNLAGLTAGEAAAAGGKFARFMDALKQPGSLFVFSNEAGEATKEVYAKYGDKVTDFDLGFALLTGVVNTGIENYETKLGRGIQSIVMSGKWPGLVGIMASGVTEASEEMRQEWTPRVNQLAADLLSGRDVSAALDPTQKGALFNVAEYLDIGAKTLVSSLGMSAFMGGVNLGAQPYRTAVQHVLEGTATPVEKQMAAQAATMAAADLEAQEAETKVETPTVEEQHDAFEAEASGENRGNDRPAQSTDRRAQAEADKAERIAQEGFTRTEVEAYRNPEAMSLEDVQDIVENGGRPRPVEPVEKPADGYDWRRDQQAMYDHWYDEERDAMMESAAPEQSAEPTQEEAVRRSLEEMDRQDAEEARQAEEARKAEEARQAEEARKAEEERATAEKEERKAKSRHPRKPRHAKDIRRAMMDAGLTQEQADQAVQPATPEELDARADALEAAGAPAEVVGDLREQADEGRTEQGQAERDKDLTDEEWDEVKRYLDVFETTAPDVIDNMAKSYERDGDQEGADRLRRAADRMRKTESETAANNTNTDEQEIGDQEVTQEKALARARTKYEFDENVYRDLARQLEKADSQANRLRNMVDDLEAKNAKKRKLEEARQALDEAQRRADGIYADYSEAKSAWEKSKAEYERLSQEADKSKQPEGTRKPAFDAAAIDVNADALEAIGAPAEVVEEMRAQAEEQRQVEKKGRKGRPQWKIWEDEARDQDENGEYDWRLSQQELRDSMMETEAEQARKEAEDAAAEQTAQAEERRNTPIEGKSQADAQQAQDEELVNHEGKRRPEPERVSDQTVDNRGQETKEQTSEAQETGTEKQLPSRPDESAPGEELVNHDGKRPPRPERVTDQTVENKGQTEEQAVTAQGKEKENQMPNRPVESAPGEEMVDHDGKRPPEPERVSDQRVAEQPETVEDTRNQKPETMMGQTGESVEKDTQEPVQPPREAVTEPETEEEEETGTGTAVRESVEKTPEEQERERQETENANRHNDALGFNHYDGKTWTPGVQIRTAPADIDRTKQAELTVLDGYARESGFTMVAESSITTPDGAEVNGYYNPEEDSGRVIHVSMTSENPLRSTMGHELYHMIKQVNPEGAVKVARAFDKYAARAGIDVRELIKNKVDLYYGQGILKDNDLNRHRGYAYEEVVADAMMDVIGDERTVRMLALEDRNLIRRMQDWIAKTMDRIHKMLDSYAKGSPEARTLAGQEDALREVREVFNRALQDADDLGRSKKAGKSMGANSRMTEAFVKGIDAATNYEEANAVATKLAASVLRANGLETSDMNMNTLIGASQLMASGMMPGEAFADTVLEGKIPNTPENNRAVMALGRYVVSLEENNRAEEYEALFGVGAETEETERKDDQNFRYSAKTSKDQEYRRAVEDGDMEKAQRMVDQEAKDAGYSIDAWHGSDAAPFTVFKPGMRGEMWFASTETTAYDRKNMYHTYLKMNNPYEETDYLGSNTKFDPTTVTEEGRRNGHDGAIVHFRLDPEYVNKNIKLIRKDVLATDKFGDNFMFLPHGEDRKNLAKPGETLVEFMKRGMEEDLYKWYTVYKPEQIKSAEPVTYDKSGEMINLSARFNEKNPDIRWSAKKDRDNDIESRTDDEKRLNEVASDVLRGDLAAWDLLSAMRDIKRRMTQDEDGREVTVKGHWKGDVGKIAQALAQDVGGGEVKKIREAVTAFFQGMDDFEGSNASFFEHALQTAQTLVTDLYLEQHRQYAEAMMAEAGQSGREALRDYFKGGYWYISPALKEYVERFIGPYAEFRKTMSANGIRVTTVEGRKRSGSTYDLENVWKAGDESGLYELLGGEDTDSVGDILQKAYDAVVNGTEETEGMPLTQEEYDLAGKIGTALVADYLQAGAKVITTHSVSKIDDQRHRETVEALDQAKAETEAQRDEIERKNAKIEELNEQIDQLHTAMSKEISKTFELGRQLKELKASGANAQELAQAKEALKAAEAEKQKAIKAYDQARQKLADRKAEIKDLTVKLRKAQKAQERATEKLSDLKERRAEQMNALRDRLVNKYREEAKERIDRAKARQKKTAYRRKQIAGIRKTGQTLRTYMAHPNASRGYIPAENARCAAELIEAMMANDGRKSAEKAGRQLMNSIRDAKESPDYFVSTMYDDELNKAMQDVAKMLEDKQSLQNLTDDELAYINKTLKAIVYQIKNNGVTIGRKKNAELSAEAADGVLVMNRNKLKMDGLGRLVRKGVLTQLNPQRFYAIWGHHGDNAITRMGEEQSEGQRKKNKLKMAMTKVFEGLTKGENEKKFDQFTGKHATWHDTGIQILKSTGEDSGKTWKMNGAMRAFFALSFQTLDNRNGMVYETQDGQPIYQLTIPDEELMKKGNEKEAYARGDRVFFTTEQAEHIIDELTDYEKEWMAAWRTMEQLSKSAINETSMLLNGFRKANVNDYVPIFRDPRFVGKEFETVLTDSRLTSMGFLKERVDAHNPMMLMDLTNVINRQVRDVSDYYGFAIPARNATKIYNGNLGGTSFKEVLNNTQGPEVAQYFEKLMADLQGINRVEPSILDKVRGNVAGATLAGNPSVIIKQAASYPAAASVLGWKPLLKAMRHFNPAGLKGINVEHIDQYTSALWERRSQSLSDLEANANRNNRMSKALHWLTNGIQGMDIATTKVIWRACEYYVDENMKSLARGSEEYNQAVARVYEQALEQTQPEYGVMQRPGVLRSKNQLVKSLTMYKTQSLQNFGILVDSTTNVIDMKKALAKADTEENRQAYAAAKRQMATALSSQITSAVILGVMTAVGKALLHKLGGYRDDKGDLTAESVGGQILKDSASSVAGMVTGGSELFDLIAGLIEGQSPFDIEAAGVSTINDLYQNTYAFLDACKVIGDGDMSDAQKLSQMWPKLRKMGLSVAQLYGIPAGNFLNLIDGIAANAADLAAGKAGSFQSASPLSIGGTALIGSAQGRETSNKSVAGYIAQAMMEGNEAEAVRLYNEQLRQGKSADSLNTAIAAWQKANIPQIRDAAEAIEWGDLKAYNELINELTGMGLSMANAVKYVEAERAKMQKEGPEEAETQAPAAMTYQDIVAGMTKSDSSLAYTNGQMNSLLEYGDVEQARAIRDEMIAGGKTASSINSSLSSHWKPLLQAAYENGDMAEVRRITDMLVQMGMKRTTIQGWTSEGGTKSSGTKSSSSGKFGSGKFGSGSFGSGSSSKKKSGFGSGKFGSGKFGS